jgi:ATP-dependent helicase/nuclease subunit B
LFEEDAGISVSRLEKYANCAYSHFLKYGLSLLERKEYRIEASDIGNLFHSSIELCFNEVDAKGYEISQLTDEVRRGIVKNVFAELQKNIP